MTELPEMKPLRRRPRSLFFPLLLITVGIVLFLSNANLLGSDVWQIAWRLWPLILVVGGLDGLYRGDGIIFPLVWISLGAALLLSNFGYLPGQSWQVLLRLWPVLLVAIGIDLLFGRQATPLATTLRVLVGLALAAGVIWLSFTSVSTRAANHVSFVQTLNGAQSASISLVQAVGRLELSGSTGADTLIKGEADLNGSETIDRTYRVTEGKGIFKASTSGIVMAPMEVGTEPWRFVVNGNIPLTLDAHMAAGDVNVNLTGLKVTNFVIESAVGQVLVALPRGQKLSGQVKGAVGNIILFVPCGAKIHLDVTTAVGSMSMPPEGTFDTPAAQADYDINVDMAVGSVQVKCLP